MLFEAEYDTIYKTRTCKKCLIDKFSIMMSSTKVVDVKPCTVSLSRHSLIQHTNKFLYFVWSHSNNIFTF